MSARLWKQLAIATNWPILAAVLVLCALGVLSIYADEPSDGVKQAVFLVIGIGCMAAFQTINYQRIGRWSWAFYLFSLLVIAYTILGAALANKEGVSPVPFMGRVKGTFAWINFGRFSLQPAELTKIAFVLVLARYLRFRSNYRTLKGLLAPFALAAVPILMILKQPDLGTALTFIPALFAMLFVAGAKLRHLAIICAMGAALVPIAWFSGSREETGLGYEVPILRHFPALLQNYQRARIVAMFAPGQSLAAQNFQTQKALIAMGSGGVSGKGALNVPIGKNVPEGHNDMIFALIGEQFGFFGSAVTIGAYMVLFAAGIEIASATKEPFGRLLAVGIVALLAGQTFINLMVCMRLMPVTGVTLPYVSAGGSSLLASFIAAGLLLNVGQNRPLVIARESFEF